jgi:WD40 repeat protein/transcriptional regulator with XRE-family HTH domain
MIDQRLTVRYEDDLGEFIADLRSKNFNSKLEAARYFNLARPTVSRYESGQIMPPLGYLLALALLWARQLASEGKETESFQEGLVQELNKVQRWHYRHKEPSLKPFRNWGEVSAAAEFYLSERRGETGKENAVAKVAAFQDWGEAVEANPFYGREGELAILGQWLLREQCRMVALLGIGGTGKTCLSIKLAQRLSTDFSFVIWRSLRGAPPLDELLADCLQIVSRQPGAALPESLDGRISRLLEYLRKWRCLIVLDNLETILDEGSHQPRYRPGYEGYGELFRRLGESSHQSCLLLTSREKPPELEFLEGRSAPVRSFAVGGLDQVASRLILEERGLRGAAEVLDNLSASYSGNPLALKLVSATILELFGGEVEEFLKQGQLILGGVSRVLDQQFARLSALEQNVMYWLAIGREFVPLAQLQTDSGLVGQKKELLESLKSLHGRSLIERSAGGAAFSQQAVIMEYVTGRLVEEVSRELKDGELNLISRYLLLKAQDKDYIRYSQARLLVRPVLDSLLGVFKSEAVLEQHLASLLPRLRMLPRSEQGYAGGNLVNLLAHLKGELRGYDFSDLNVWQAYLQGVNLQDSSFARADLTGSVFTESFSAISTLSYSPDGKFLAAGCADGEIRLWRVSDSRLLINYQGHAGAVQSLAFSPNSRLLVTGGTDQQVKLWEIVVEGQLYPEGLPCRAVLSGHTEWVWSVAFSPDGKFLASSGSDWQIKIWEVQSGQCLKNLTGHSNSVRAIAISPDGRFLASGGGDRVIKLWEIASGTCIETIPAHDDWVQTLAFSLDGRFLASGSEDRSVKLWALGQETTCVQTLREHQEWIWSIAFSPDSTQLASASGDHTIKLWEVNSGECLQTLQGHRGLVRAVAFHPDGEVLASGGGSRQLRLWEMATGRCFRSVQGHSNPLRAAAFSPDSSLLASSSGDRLLRFWDVRAEALVSDGEITRPLKTWTGHRELVWSLAYSPDGKFLATGSEEGTVKLWEVATGQCLRVMIGHSEWVQSIAFSPDGQWLASGSGDRKVRVWEVATGQCRYILSEHNQWIWSVAFSPDGKLLASSGNDRCIKIWEMAGGRCLRTLPQSIFVLITAFSPDGKYLAASGGPNHAATVWDTATWETCQLLTGHARKIWTLNFSPDSRLLATGSEDGVIKLWEVASGRNLRTWAGHREWLRSLVFSPDERLLASAGEDGTIHLWSPARAESVAIFRSERPYERLNLTGATGLNEAQRASLKALGAFED